MTKDYYILSSFRIDKVSKHVLALTAGLTIGRHLLRQQFALIFTLQPICRIYERSYRLKNLIKINDNTRENTQIQTGVQDTGAFLEAIFSYFTSQLNQTLKISIDFFILTCL